MATIIDGTTGSSIAGNATITGNATVQGNLTVTGTLFGGVPSGAVFWFAASTPPTGYLKANGAVVSRTTYAALFAAIGTTFGAGDGSTTFALPDLRGEFLRGWDDGRGIDSGRAFGSAQAAAFASHTHGIYYNGGNGGVTGSQSGINTGTNGAAYTSAPTGGTETRPRNIALLACIKT
jgi:microcystin-dependent protein